MVCGLDGAREICSSRDTESLVSRRLLLLDFPRLELASPAVILSGIAIVVDHYLWFGHIIASPPMPFINTVGFFLFFVWIVPFSFLISLSINEYALPLGTAQQGESSRSASLFKRLFETVSDSLRPHAQRAAAQAHTFDHSKTY